MLVSCLLVKELRELECAILVLVLVLNGMGRRRQGTRLKYLRWGYFYPLYRSRRSLVSTSLTGRFRCWASVGWCCIRRYRHDAVLCDVSRMRWEPTVLD
ncbi:hypothetical protein K458DRAFT_175800 [Lentithecium fluviatile CBS 122367]|uniref:Uncharacterized protein n=1 Tax=Lentithecium fluviatile CBS 122367 TaxID=1168545 RepID=A0A6G1JC57_9PLEO|nr:hypothetical protein K458DRAFT_175800 [Lentithecium fluviatile CBS 122367]